MNILPNGAFSPELAARLAEREEWWFDEPLAHELARLFQGKSVGDFGAGIGRYTDFLSAQGVKCRGYDAIPEIHAITGGTVRYLDLCLPSPPGTNRRFDWALCLEVMEHIPTESESIALANLDGFNTCGVLISWAVPGQGGHGHVNEQPNQHAINWFTAHAYAHQQTMQDKLRQAARIQWFKNTIMVFTKRQ